MSTSTSASTADQGTAVHTYLTQIHAASTPTDCSTIYDDWSKTYDLDVQHSGIDYVGPLRTAQAVASNLAVPASASAGSNLSTARILDAGCGTGLVGVALAELGATKGKIDGMDISPGMLEVAKRTGVYGDLSVADMCQTLSTIGDKVYDVVTCTGCFTDDHVPPSPALGELVRVTKVGGLVVATVVDRVWAAGGYEAEVDRLRATAGLVEVVSTENAEYRRGTDTKARIVVLRRR